MNKLGAVNYLVPPPDFIWTWEEDYAAVKWQNGNTIAVWPELHALINHLVPYGLPPLGSILMVLMACQGRSNEALDSAVNFSAATTGGNQPSGPSRLLLMRSRDVLQSIEALPAELRTGLPARAHLLVNLFEDVQNRMPPENSKNVLEQLDIYDLEYLNQSQSSLSGGTRLLRDLKALATVATKRNLEKLETLLRAGFEYATISPVLVPPPKAIPGDTTLPLLKQLEEHPERELGIIAATARRMVAMFTVPRPAGHPQELPVGGISDITNRGTLDRLIPSELAYDDLTLTARLANNEALYFRRDTPPDEPATERIILLDSGLHLWGTPRVFALAAALGLQSQAPANEAVSTYHREGRHFQKISLDSVDAVKNYLQELPSDPDPASALTTFHLNESSPLRPDVFFISVEQNREPVLRALHNLAMEVTSAGGHLYLLAVSRSGALGLTVRSSVGSKEIASGRIDPDSLFSSPTTAEPQIKPKGGNVIFNHPERIRSLAYYQHYPLPFRFPASPYSKPLESGLHRLQMSTDGRLMLWNEGHIGAVEICAGIAAARDYTICQQAGEIVVVGSALQPGGKVTAVVIDERTGSRRDLILASSHAFPGRAKVLNGAIILSYSGKAEACSLEDGRLLHSITFPTSVHFDAIRFDGRKLEARPSPPSSPQMPNGIPRPKLEPPKVMPTPISCGFDSNNELVIHTQSGRWCLKMPTLHLTPTRTTTLSKIQSFVAIPGVDPSETVPKFYQAEWHADCRLIYDSRGLLHFVFRDKQGSVELSLLALLDRPSAVWVRDWPQFFAGEEQWFDSPESGQNTNSKLNAVPIFMRFAAATHSMIPVALPTITNQPQDTFSISSGSN